MKFNAFWGCKIKWENWNLNKNNWNTGIHSTTCKSGLIYSINRTCKPIIDTTNRVNNWFKTIFITKILSITTLLCASTKHHSHECFIEELLPALWLPIFRIRVVVNTLIYTSLYVTLGMLNPLIAKQSFKLTNDELSMAGDPSGWKRSFTLTHIYASSRKVALKF